MPLKLHYAPGSLVRLAACLGDDGARVMLPPDVQRVLDDPFAVLMSCSDVEYGPKYDFGPPCSWPYTLEAAMRMAIAVFRDFLPDWDQCWQLRKADIPKNVPVDFANKVIAAVSNWIVKPLSFSWEQWDKLYAWIGDEVCLDGYLAQDHPKTPSIVQAFCYGACHLIEIENCDPDAGAISHTYHPQGHFSARMADAIAWFLVEGFSESRIRDAIRRELIPWCMDRDDVLRRTG